MSNIYLAGRFSRRHELHALGKTVEFWGIAKQPIIDVIESDGRGYTRYIEQGRKVSSKREARQIARDLGASFYC